MDPKDLLALFDLAGPDPPGPADARSVCTPTDASPDTMASPTALVLDAWAVRRGRELVAESERLRRLGTGDLAAADFHAAAFLPDPVPAGACEDALRGAFVRDLLDTPEYRTLHAATALCGPAAEVAAVKFAEQFAALQQEAGRAGGGDPEMAAFRAAARAAAAADAEVRDLTDAAAALGLGPGAPGANDPRAIADVFKRVRSDPGLRRVCDLAGRFRRVAQGKQRMKAAHGFDDMVGVTVGGDVGRLLVSELARLCDPDLEMETLRRIAEKAALCRDHRAVEPAGKGPVLVVVDESGSMAGARVETAKALALALAWVARRQRRWTGLVAYSGDTGERLLALPPGRWDEARLADWLAAFLGGGSSLDVPVRELPDYYRRLHAPPGVTDVVIVTDARCHIPCDLAARFHAWKAAVRARVIGLVVASDPGDLARICDEAHRVPALAPDDPAVGKVLSI